MVKSDIMGHVGVMLWHLKGHRGDLPVGPAWYLHDHCMTWEGKFLTHFLKPLFGGPSGATCAKRVPKWYQKVSKKWSFLENENIDSDCYLLYFGHIDPSKSLPKIDEKIGPHKSWPKRHQHTQHSAKMVPKWSAPFSRICSKMGSNFDVDPKMAPRGVRGPQNGPQRRNMTQKCTKMTSKWTKHGTKMDQNTPPKYWQFSLQFLNQIGLSFPIGPTQAYCCH